LAGKVGLEPTTFCTKNRCSTIELLPIIWCSERDSNSHAVKHRYLKPACLPIPPSEHYLERVRRIELLSLAWKAKVLPLHNTRFILFMYLIIQSISSLSTIILKWHQQVSSKTFNGSSCLQTLCASFYTYAGTRIFLFLLFKINLAVCGGIKPPLTGCSPSRLYEQTLYGAG
jgi:hypothetical protein